MHAYEWTSAHVFLWATPDFTTYESDTQLCTVTHYVHTYIHAYIHTYIHVPTMYIKYILQSSVCVHTQLIGNISCSVEYRS